MYIYTVYIYILDRTHILKDIYGRRSVGSIPYLERSARHFNLRCTITIAGSRNMEQWEVGGVHWRTVRGRRGNVGLKYEILLLGSTKILPVEAPISVHESGK